MSEDQKTALQVEREAFEAEAAEYNKAQTGKGLRMLVGATRGRNTMNIKYQAFDESVPESLPKTLQEFVEITGIKDNAELASLLITGFNDKAYTEASDPIAEFVNKSWDDETRSKFKAAVRLLVSLQGLSIQEAVDMVRPGIEKKLASQK